MSTYIKAEQSDTDIDTYEPNDDRTGLVQRAYSSSRDLVLKPLQLLTSKFALRAYITSILLSIAIIFLFGLAVTAYTLFYWSYIPRIGFERAIHLQFDPVQSTRALPTGTSTDITLQRTTHVQPYGLVPLTPEIASQQQYDISVELTMPRTPSNTRIGNFMLDCRLYGPPTDKSAAAAHSNAAIQSHNADASAQLLAHARRPATLTWLSREVELATRISQLHWFILGWRREQETLSIPVFERVEFARGRKHTPVSFRLELQVPGRGAAQMDKSDLSLQVYSAKVVFRARFRGLRYIMYNHRIISAAVFITCFWLTEVVAMGLVWGLLSLVIFGPRSRGYADQDDSDQTLDSVGRVKEEHSVDEAEMSDTERAFPTYDRSGRPMKYTSPVKTEIDADEADGSGLGAIPPLLTTAAEADDEDDEDADFLLDETGKWGDSGIGTSMDSGAGGPSSLKSAASLRRRRSRN